MPHHSAADPRTLRWQPAWNSYIPHTELKRPKISNQYNPKSHESGSPGGDLSTNSGEQACCWWSAEIPGEDLTSYRLVTIVPSLFSSPWPRLVQCSYLMTHQTRILKGSNFDSGVTRVWAGLYDRDSFWKGDLVKRLLKSGNLSQQSCRHKSWTRSVVWEQPPAPVLAPVVDWVWLKLVLGWNNAEKLLFHDKDVQYICDQVGILILISSIFENIDIELQKSDMHISEVTWHVPGAIRGSPFFM